MITLALSKKKEKQCLLPNLLMVKDLQINQKK